MLCGLELMLIEYIVMQECAEDHSPSLQPWSGWPRPSVKKVAAVVLVDFDLQSLGVDVSSMFGRTFCFWICRRSPLKQQCIDTLSQLEQQGVGTHAIVTRPFFISNFAAWQFDLLISDSANTCAMMPLAFNLAHQSL